MRDCYGSNRLSEDLDFTGGVDFSRDKLASMASVLSSSLKNKYGLEVNVSEPTRKEGNVDTWKIKVQTRSARRDIRVQRINIDVCSIPSYQARPMMILNAYGVDMGTDGLILQAQSREEIFADKLLAFALRPNRLKNRDLWYIAWLNQQQVKPALGLISQKLIDHQASLKDCLLAFSNQAESLKTDPAIALEFRKEMGRFLPSHLVRDTVNSEDFWVFLSNLMNEYLQQVTQDLGTDASTRTYKM